MAHISFDNFAFSNAEPVRNLFAPYRYCTTYSAYLRYVIEFTCNIDLSHKYELGNVGSSGDIRT